MENISILGSTGSIGTQAIDVIDSLGNITVSALTANTNTDLIEEQARRLRPVMAGMCDEKCAGVLKERLFGTGIRVYAGEEALMRAAEQSEADTVLTAVVGNSGIRPTFAAIEAGKNIALANKETLVSAGKLFTKRVREKGTLVLPVDSEHSAIFQCLEGAGDNRIKRILLTASGGAFRGRTAQQLRDVTASDALKHPTWNMGAKVTIDSATLMNKGLEVVEAKWLFGAELEQIKVVVHPQSVVHSAVEFEDNSVIAQLGVPDMRGPIQYAFTWPERKPSRIAELDLFGYGSLTFEEPDTDTFRCLPLAFRAERTGGTSMCIVNGANEIAVGRFLRGEISFLQIADIIEKTLEHVEPVIDYTLDDIFAADRAAREYASNIEP
ncbi:MAG: 1-deoxy-D-xylulose-5-phosphate reductoisomerase [Eubacteriales bacterium]|nr:1-deoxy-D-xylulose-5-phosphate reductoisomerase [Eubacteriales bacterium]